MRRALWITLVALFWAALLAVPNTDHWHIWQLAAVGLIVGGCIAGGGRDATREWWPRVFVVWAVAVLALAWNWQVPQLADQGAYCDLGRSLWRDGRYEFGLGGHPAYCWRPPGMALVLGPSLLLGLPDWLGVSLVGIGSVGLATWAVSGSQGPQHHAVIPRAALLTAWAAALPWCLSAFSELPALALILWCVRLVPGERGRLRELPPKTVLTAGLLQGAASLFRPTFVVLALLPAAAIAIAGGRRQGPPKAALMLVGVALPILPWTLRNRFVTGEWILISSNGGELFYSANASNRPDEQGDYNPQFVDRLRVLAPMEGRRDRLGYRLGLAAIREHPLRFARSLPERFGVMAADLPLHAADMLAERQRRTSFFAALAPMAFLGYAAIGAVCVTALRRRGAIRTRLLSSSYLPWKEASIVICLCLQLLFECRFGRYMLPIIAYILPLLVLQSAGPLSCARRASAIEQPTENA